MRGRLARAGIAFGILAAVAPLTPAQAGGGGGCVGVHTIGRSTVVVMRDACFTPTIARVPVGSTVKWVNKDPYQHTVTGAGLVFGNAEPFGLDGTTRARFAQPGIYPYYCTIHVGMAGAIVVGDESQLANALNRETASITPESVSNVLENAPADLAKTAKKATTSAWPAVAGLIGAGSVGLGFVVGRRRGNGRAHEPPQP